MIEVRAAKLSDIPAIAEIELSAGNLFRHTHMDWAVGDTTDHAKLASAIGKHDLWVAEIDKELAAFLLAGVCGAAFHISEVAVHQDYQGKRVGVALMKAALCEAKRRGHHKATLTTDRHLAWNAPYYARLGFVDLAPEETPDELAKILAGEPNPHLRCAMQKML